MKLFYTSVILFLLIGFSACKKETITLSGNTPPLINNVPAVKIENYVNRIFIDLIGREPLDNEMATEVENLRQADLSKDARLTLIQKLQTNTVFIEGDTSYQKAYHQHLYNLAKVRLIEGASDRYIKETIGGSEDSLLIMKLQAVLDSKLDMEQGFITYDQMLGRMIFNAVYDQINMNSFNFVNATFDNLLWRFPTNTEFEAGYDMVEFEFERSIFGTTGSSKTDYVAIISSTDELFEGIIIWAYQTILARFPTTEETAQLLDDYIQHKDIRLVQQHIMIKDEYANFE